MINAVLLAVIVMLVLSLARLHVVLALVIGAVVGGLMAGIGLQPTLESFATGMKEGASIALSYVMLGGFAMAIAHSGLPGAIARWVIAMAGGGARADTADGVVATRRARRVRWGVLIALVIMAVASQNVIPIHIAFIPLLIPPLLLATDRLRLDRRAMACAMTFGLVGTYMFLPVGFGNIFLNEILLGNIQQSGLDTQGVDVMGAMLIPWCGLLVGLLLALLWSYRKPRDYCSSDLDAGSVASAQAPRVDAWALLATLAAIVLSFAVQLYADSLLLGSLVGFGVLMATRVVKWRESGEVFNRGIAMMAMIGFIMIAAQGFAEVMRATGQIADLVGAVSEIFGNSKAVAAFAMLLVGLVITMGIGSSFSTLPIIAAIYVPLCVAMGFSPLATVALIGTAGALGDAGSPASDSTLGPTAGLNADGQHDHIRDTVIPTFVHYNIPLLLAGWGAAMVL